MLLSAIPKKMQLSGKERGDIVKIYYLNGQNASQTLRDYGRNHGLMRCSCTVNAVLHLIHKFEETGCTCDRPQSGRTSDPVETVAEIHQTISIFRPTSVRGASIVLCLPNSTVSKILCSVLNKCFRFDSRVSRCWRDSQLRLDFANKVFIHHDEDSSWPLRIL